VGCLLALSPGGKHITVSSTCLEKGTAYIWGGLEYLDYVWGVFDVIHLSTGSTTITNTHIYMINA
jgi:hypothetical protein